MHDNDMHIYIQNDCYLHYSEAFPFPSRLGFDAPHYAIPNILLLATPQHEVCLNVLSRTIHIRG